MRYTLTRFTGPLKKKQHHNITEHPPPPYLHTGYFQYRHFSFYTKPTLSVSCRNVSFAFNLTTRRTPGAYVYGEMTGKAFLWYAFQIICWHGGDV